MKVYNDKKNRKKEEMTQLGSDDRGRAECIYFPAFSPEINY